MIEQQARGMPFRFDLREASGALADLGTLLPLLLGCIAVGGVAMLPAVLGFAVFYVATGLYYRLPIPVQPMKAVAAVVLTAGITPAGLAASGVLLGATLLVLGLTGWIQHLARLVPQSVLAGLQLGLGLALAGVGLELMASAPLLACVVLGVILALLFAPRLPAVLIALALAMLLAPLLQAPGIVVAAADVAALASLQLPTPAELGAALSQLVLPQLSLTFTNAILLTALVAGDYFGERARHVTPVRLSVSSGLANLLLAPFGALPMCHGAGGLAAHYRFGARSGAAPGLLGAALGLFALLPRELALAVLTAIPAAGLGALLLVAASELAFSKRLFDSRPSCWPVILVTAVATLWLNPFWGLVAGFLAEAARKAALRRFLGDSSA